jgi:hypothetical protein
MQTIKPPSKLKRKTVYFVKTAPARLDNDNIKSLVGSAVCAGGSSGSCAARAAPAALHAVLRP